VQIKTITSLVLILTASAVAQFVGPSSQLPVSTVSQVLKDAGSLDRRDVHVALRGKIVSYLHGDYYYFKDNTGTLLIELEPEDMPRQPFDDKTPLMIYGEVDAEWFEKTKLDVSRVVILGGPSSGPIAPPVPNIPRATSTPR
jgi:uncharacterized protein (TIGR00156 family)